MECSLCEYKWCWTCGIHQDHWVHSLSGDGQLCQIINFLVFGFDQTMSKCGRISVTIFLTIFFPVILYGIIVIMLMSVTFGYCSRLNGTKLEDYCFTRFVVLPLIVVIIFLTQLGLCVIGGVVVYAVVLAPMILFLVFMILRIVFWWAIKNCKINKKLSE